MKLHFEGVYQKAEVFVNGQKAGQHHYGYTPFTVDVTPYINKDKKEVNEVVVKVDNSDQPNCRWYSGSGIYRLTFVTVEVLDKQGTPVPEAAIDCEAVVNGAGTLSAFASADLKDTEPYTSPRVKTWKGRALLVVRSTQKKGSVSVSIKSALPTARLTLKSK